jgi:sporulation protein YlmC with PRC-barrel domain
MGDLDQRDRNMDDYTQRLVERLDNPNGLENQPVREKLIRIGQPAVPALIKALDSVSNRVRWEAALILGSIGGRHATKALIAALKDENIGVRWMAMDSLIALDRAAVIPLLLALRKDFGSVQVREGAYHIFHVLKERGHLPKPLSQVFDSLISVEPEVEVPWAVECALEELHIRPSNEEKGKIAMDIPMNAKVWCTDGGGGTSTHVIIDPIKDKVTHMVIREKSFPFEERLVPVEDIVESSPTEIRLNCTVEGLSKMEAYLQTEFLPGEYANLGVSMLWPYASPEFPFMLMEHKMVPANELSIRRGAEVLATDGRVGKVDEFLAEPESGGITHLVLREGHLWGQKDITIPISQIDRIEQDKVYLKVDQNIIESLPAIPIHHRQEHHQESSS